MNTTAAIFFLVLGQADGASAAAYPAGSGGLTTIPSHYTSQVECEAAGEAARANNLGLSYLSYTCVPGIVNIEEARFEVLWPAKPLAEASVSKAAACAEVCEARP